MLSVKFGPQISSAEIPGRVQIETVDEADG